MTGYVYFVDDGQGHIKVGKTSDMNQRLPSLQTGNAARLTVRLVLECKTMDDAGKVERYIHKAFRAIRVQHEWFNCTPAFSGFLDQFAQCNEIAIGGVSTVVQGAAKKRVSRKAIVRRDVRPEHDMELYSEAVELVQRINKASIGMLQRRLGIGYERAKRLITLMHVCGVIGPEVKGANCREVYR